MSDLSHQLIQLEKDRKSIIRRSTIPKGIAVVLLLASIAFFLLESVLFSVAAAAIGVLLIIQSELPKKRFKRAFKQKVIGSLAKQIDKSIIYDPDGGWTYEYLYEVGLLHVQPTSGGAEDFFSGKIGQTDVSFCEMHAERSDSDINESGKRRSSTSQLFKGLFFTADFHKDFAGDTIVLPDWVEEQDQSDIAKRFGSDSLENHRIQDFNNEDFNKLFAVFGSDDEASRKVLSASMMERLVKLYQKLSSSAECKISLAFHNQKMHLAVDWENNFFEYSIDKTVSEEVKETLEELQLCTGIVEDLNLNTQIWS
jgi:hypothetical protein